MRDHKWVLTLNLLPSDTYLTILKGELHSYYIFLYFVLIGLEWDSITLFKKMNFFSSKLTIYTIYIYIYIYIYMAFYLLT